MSGHDYERKSFSVAVAPGKISQEQWDRIFKRKSPIGVCRIGRATGDSNVNVTCQCDCPEGQCRYDNQWNRVR
jgi:hypothetical protein